MSTGSDTQGNAERSGTLALVDSLSAVRKIIAASACPAVGDLLAATVDALIQHQDFDGCEVLIDSDGSSHPLMASDDRRAARMPLYLDAVLISEVFPAIVGDGYVFVEPKLHDRSADWSGSLLGVPINDGDRVIGGLVVWNQEPDRLLPWHQSLLEMMSEVIVFGLGGRARQTGHPGEVPGRDEIGRPRLRAPVEHDLKAPAAADVGVDALTGLMDRLSFEVRLQALAVIPANSLQARFVYFIDIDRFRLIREYGGNMNAERLLRVFADLLRRETAGELLLGRLGVDQFGLVADRRSPEQAVNLAEALVGVVDALRLSFSGQRYDVSISVGVAELGGKVGSGVAALRRAAQACRAAQMHGGSAVQAYHEDLAGRRGSRTEGRLLNRLMRALKDETLELLAQSITRLDEATQQHASPRHMHELLLRMRDDDGDIIGAGAFLTVAERYGLSVKLDRWVIQRAFWQIAGTRFANDPEHRFTLNLSGHSIDNHRLLDFIIEQFELSGLPPERICFEITETAAISDIGAAKQFVEALQALGCEFALDDFGSGHSSFLYLRDLPVNYLKIDGELVREIAQDAVSLAFVRTIEGVARLMGRRTIAEYVESEEIRDAIAEIGCDYVQGYWVGCPIPLADVLRCPDG
jgi:diguanylate cyclase (GGDEF)-like protein